MTHFNLKIWRPEATKNIKNLRKKFCEFRPRVEIHNSLPSEFVNRTPVNRTSR